MTTEHANPAKTAASTLVQFRLVTRHATCSAAAAEENQRRVEAVFAELAGNRPDNVTYLVLRLADDSFVHVSFHGHVPGDANPISSLASFAQFADDHVERRQGEVNQQQARLVGSHVTVAG
jgi:hypothetical protein